MNTATQDVYFVLTGLPEITAEALADPEGLREYIEVYIADNEDGDLDWMSGELDEVDWDALRGELEKA